MKKTDKLRVLSRIQSLLYVIDPNGLSDEIKSSELRLETGKRDKKLFKAIITGQGYLIHKDGHRKSHKNLTSTLEFFKKRISEIKKENGIIAFAEKVIKCQFVVMTAEQKSDKHIPFRSVNARGLKYCKRLKVGI